jgi:phosphoribosylanthranilate isomerase
MARTRIKICGIRDAESAFVAVESGADAIGFVFAPGSPRTITPDAAWEVAAVLPPFVQTVGLFVDPKLDAFDQAREACPTDLVQLHGTEPEPVVRDCGPDVVKAVRYDRSTIEAELMRWNRVDDVVAVLVDGGPGGTGEKADWDHLAEVASATDHPLILAGGLTPENVGEAIAAVRPYAVDVSSGVESEPGTKDPAKIAAFCRAVREADVAATGGS